MIEPERENSQSPWEVIEGLDFYPWKGPKYGPNSDFGIRILVMGESTYVRNEDEECPRELYERQRKAIGPGWFAHYNVFAYRKVKWNDRFWTKLTSALSGRSQKTLENRQLVWDNVAFWNYANGEPLSDHSQPLREEVKKRANSRLRLVIDALKPDLVILVSLGLWTNLSNGNDRFEGCDPEAPSSSLFMQDVVGRKIGFLRLPHPRSSLFRYAVVCPRVEQAIETLQGHIPRPRQSASNGRPNIRPKEGDLFQIAVRKLCGAWVFDDASRGFSTQPFVHGTTDMIDELVKRTTGVSNEFTLSFSSRPFDRHSIVLGRVPGKKSRSGLDCYRLEGTGREAYICKDIDRYFGSAPEEIYCTATPPPS